MNEKEQEASARPRKAKTLVLEPDQFRFIKRLPWEKITIWGIFLALIYMLRSFFGILFLTFLITYISSNLVSWGCEKAGIAARPGHWLRYAITIGVFLSFLAVLTGAGFLVFPELFAQGKKLAEEARYLIPSAPEKMTPEERADALLREVLGEKEHAAFKETPNYYPLRMEISQALRKLPGREKPAAVQYSPEAAVIPDFGPAPEPLESTAGPKSPRKKDLLQHIDSLLLSSLGQERFEEFQRSQAYKDTYSQLIKNVQGGATESLPAVVDYLTSIAAKIALYTLHFTLAIIFSFMIVLGIPGFKKQIRSLENSRIGNFYREIAPSVISFGRSMGFAFQGQAIIALVNTALTMIGVVLLGIPNVIALGVIVFLCSFIPVAGMFISGAPIVAIALQEGGVFRAVEVVILISLIHALEAYVLNPRIMGHIMHMHPLLVLVILFVGEHYFGVWGLLIGVPLCHYLFNQVILRNPVPDKGKTRFAEPGRRPAGETAHGLPGPDNAPAPETPEGEAGGQST